MDFPLYEFLLNMSNKEPPPNREMVKKYCDKLLEIPEENKNILNIIYLLIRHHYNLGDQKRKIKPIPFDGKTISDSRGVKFEEDIQEVFGPELLGIIYQYCKASIELIE
jgi:hypothetical protein